MMSWRLLVSLLVCAFVLSFSVVVLAQQSFSGAEDTVMFTYPDAWRVTDGGGGFVFMDGDGFQVRMLTPPALARLGYDRLATPVALAEQLATDRNYQVVSQTEFDADGLAVARLDYTSTSAPSGFFLVFDTTNDLIVFDVVAVVDSMALQNELAQIAASFTYTPANVAFTTFTNAELTFEYPDYWTLEDTESGITLADEDFSATLTTPAQIAASDLARYDDPARLVTAALTEAEYIPVQFRVFKTSHRPAARFDYITSDGTTGFLLALVLDTGEQLLVDVRPVANFDPAAVHVQRALAELAASIGAEDTASAVLPVAGATQTPAATEEPIVTDEPAPATPTQTPTPSPTPSEVVFTTTDGSLALTHSSEWFVGEDTTANTVYAFLGEPAVSLTIYPPENLIAQQYRMTGEDPTTFLARYRSNFGIEMSDVEPVPDEDFSAARRYVNLEDGGIFVALQVNGGAYAIAEGFMFDGELTPAAENAIYDLLKTLDYSGAVVAQAEPAATESPLQPLTQYAAAPREAIAELEQQGVIPFGGRLLFQESYLFYRGGGDHLLLMSSLTTSTNLVLAGELTYTPGNLDEEEYCGLSVRRTLEARQRGYLNFGLNSQGLAFYDDQQLNPDVPNRTGSYRLETPLSDPHHFLIIVVDERMTLYLDGQPIFVNIEVEKRPGVYALVQRGAAQTSRCDGRNMWVYTLPETTNPGVCEMRTVGIVNKRSGPGTNFEIVAELPPQFTAAVIGQAAGDDGFTWWQLDDETWVRSDIVAVSGDCGAFFATPTPAADITPEATAEDND